MTDKIEFTSNYEDRCTNKGFQFEFFCDRCHGGYRTQFKTFAAGTVSEILGAASGILGGFLGKAAEISEEVRSSTWKKARDAAFSDAVAEFKPDFIQCPKCLAWVCKKSCWNQKHGLCKNCAPDLGVEMSAAQASKTIEKVWENAAVSDEDAKKISKEHWKDTIQATCPNCGKPTTENIKFCPECGAKLKTDDKCAACGSKLMPNAKFCPDCGEKIQK